MTDDIAERTRKIGGTMIRSIGHIAKVKHIEDNDADFVTPEDMLAELKEDKLAVTATGRSSYRSAWALKRKLFGILDAGNDC